MKKKLLSLLLATIMVVGLVTGCGNGGDEVSTGGDASNIDSKVEDTGDGGESSSGGDVQVGIVLPTKDEPRWLQDQKQFESILGDAGFTNQVLFSQGSSATEKTNVETLISKGIKVLIICAQGQYLIDNAPSGSDVPLYLYAGAKNGQQCIYFL